MDNLNKQHSVDKDFDEELGQEVISNLFAAFDNPLDMPVFVTKVYGGDYQEAEQRHKREMLRHIVYGKFDEMEDMMNEDAYHIAKISGFKERMGRVPNKNDEIKIIKGNQYFNRQRDFIISQVDFVIVSK